MRIAALQMVSGPRVADNLATVDALAAEAVAQGAGLVALPEYYPIFGLTDNAKVEVREDFGSGPIQAHLSALARRHRIWVIGGSLPLVARAADKVLNSTLTFAPDGRCVARTTERRWHRGATVRPRCSRSSTRPTSNHVK